MPQTTLASTDLSHSNFPAGCQEVIHVPPAFGRRQLGLGEAEGEDGGASGGDDSVHSVVFYCGYKCFNMKVYACRVGLLRV